MSNKDSLAIEWSLLLLLRLLNIHFFTHHTHTVILILDI